MKCLRKLKTCNANSKTKVAIVAVVMCKTWTQDVETQASTTRLWSACVAQLAAAEIAQERHEVFLS